MHLEFPIRPERLTPAEQRLLEYIEGNREEFLFMTIGQLAAKMGLSEATISRFARHLGCQDFKQLKNIVIEQNHLEGPAGKLAGTLFTGNGEESFQAAEYLKKQMLYLEKTMQNLEPQVFLQAVETILSAKRIFIHAKSASASMGQLLFFRLRRLGLPVAQIPSGGTEMMEGLAQAGEDDVVLFFGFSKVSWEGKVILDCRKTAGYKTICFTSRLLAPREEQADINLYVYRGEEKEYHSMTAAAAVVDALIVAISERLGADGAKNLQRIHRMKKKYRI